MNLIEITELHDALVSMEENIKARHLSGTASCHINWIGDEFTISMRASEGYKSDSWSREQDFVGDISNLESSLNLASNWIWDLPDEHERKIETALKKLSAAIETIGEDDLLAIVRQGLIDQRDALAKNQLPHPTLTETATNG